MAGSVNKVILVGNLGADPDGRALPSGGKVVSLSIATSQSWNDKQTGERRERTEWHRVVIFNERLGEVAEKYLSKGRSVYLEGELRTRKWTDQSGQDKYTTEVVIDRFRGELVLLGGNGQGGGGSSTSSGSGGNSRGGRSSGDYGAGQREAQGAPAGSGWDSRPDNSLDDEIPF